ncbi:enoyl-CoA hydratase/isomerase family protein [Halorientalis persicus]|nr:enoyl-CoA hydratase-related protein [Halorientalis persicus]
MTRTEVETGNDAIRYEIDGYTAYVTFSRPDAYNALTPAMMRAGARAIKEADNRDAVRGIVVTGNGEAFCSGADLGETIPRWTEDTTNVHPAEDDLQLRRTLITTPIVAAVNGDCLAGGMEFLQATDIRVAAESARFGLTEARWGVSPVSGSHVRLPRQLPYAKAMEYLLTADIFPADHALEAGLVNEVVPDGEVVSRAEEIVDQIAQNSPHAIRKTKESVLRCLGKPLDDAFRLESEIGREVFAHEDAVEGPRAFMNDSEPSFRPDE